MSEPGAWGHCSLSGVRLVRRVSGLVTERRAPFLNNWVLVGFNEVNRSY